MTFGKLFNVSRRSTALPACVASIEKPRETVPAKIEPTATIPAVIDLLAPAMPFAILALDFSKPESCF